MSVIRLKVECRMETIDKENSRFNRSETTIRRSRSSRLLNFNQNEKHSLLRRKRSMNTMANHHLSSSTIDPTVFIHAGTSGIRHLFPIHLNDDSFPRSISRLRSHTTNIDMIRNICSTIQTLEYFDVSDNELDDLPTEICLLNNLQSLNCSHNRLITISDSFEKLIHLKQINLSYNQLKRLPNVIYTYQNLIQLNCEYNLIKTIDKNLVYLKKLKILILDHNQIQTFETIDFSQMKSLEFIDLAHNNLQQCPLNIEKLKHLKILNLSYNKIKSFPIDLLLINSLDVLNLNNNSIEKLPPLTDVYKRISPIFSIDLSYNQLTKFYDYLLLICFKLDLSNNKIEVVCDEFFKKINYNSIINRELKINNNPLMQLFLSHDIQNQEYTNTINILQVLHHHFEQQRQIDDTLRQGFKIFITGPNKSGKSALAYCLEDYMPMIPNEKSDRIIQILQFQFQFEKFNEKPPTVKISTSKPIDSIKLKTNDAQKPRKTISNTQNKQIISIETKPSSTLTLNESMKPIPLSLFDINGHPEYHEHMSMFIDTNALHFICIHSMNFDSITPKNLEDLFSETFDRTSNLMIKQLFEILDLICEKESRTNTIFIVPIATFSDLYDKRPKQDKLKVLDKINQFFKYYLQYRNDRLKNVIKQIDSLGIISSSLSERLKTCKAILNLNIHIEQCHSISSVTCEGICELHHFMQHCITTNKIAFPHVNRVLPELWADTNRYIESLIDDLPLPCLLWDNYASQINNKYGLLNIINDITLSLLDQGKILVFNEIATKNRIVFLQPLWLCDVISALFCSSHHSDGKYQKLQNEYKQNGCLHIDLLQVLWKSILHTKENTHDLLLILMRFLLIGYPKLNKSQIKTLLQSNDKHDEIKFDYAIIPYYLPFIDKTEYDIELKRFNRKQTHSVHLTYRSFMLPVGLFHRYSVSALLKLDIVYIKHWNNFIFGEDEEKQVKFILETDHQTYFNIHFGTNIQEKPFDKIWNLLMLMLNHIEDMFKTFAPNNQFQRYVRCPHCNEYSFMGEWTTPKELQCLKAKQCVSCQKNVDTNYLVQPNESKRRNEELLKKIRERNNTTIKKNNVNSLID